MGKEGVDPDLTCELSERNMGGGKGAERRTDYGGPALQKVPGEERRSVRLGDRGLS